MLVLLYLLNLHVKVRFHSFEHSIPNRSLAILCIVSVEDIVITDWNQVLEHSLLARDDCFISYKSATFKTFKLWLVHFKYEICEESNQEVTDTETVLLENNWLLQIVYISVEISGKFVRLHKQLFKPTSKMA